MAGYLGTKAVLLSTTAATVTGKITANEIEITASTPVLTLTDTDVADEYTQLINSSGNTFIDARNGAVNGQIIFRGEGGGVTDEYGRFDELGQFGIGTNNPSAELTVNGVIQTINGADIDMDNTASGQLMLDGNGYAGAIALNDQGMNIYTNVATRDIIFGTNELERVRIDGDGKVGIGTAAPQAVLDLGSGTQGRGICWSSSASATYSNIWSSRSGARTTIGNGLRGSTSVSNGFESSVSSSWAKSAMSVGTGMVQFYTDNASTVAVGTAVTPTERMRIDSSGNLLVGTTSLTAPIVNNGGAGVVIRGVNGQIYAGGADAQPLTLNRESSDGSLTQFRKDGTSVGSIVSFSGSTSYTGSSHGIFFNSHIIAPVNSTGLVRVDNVMDIGQTAYRFDDIYATNGTIQTSDRNEKQDIASLTPTEMLVAARLSTGFKNFKWKDSVAEKGAAARMHSGIIAQDVQDAFTAEGLDAGDYALFISGTWWETQTDVPAVEAAAEVVDQDGVVVTEAVEAVAAYTRTDTYDTEAEAPVGAVSKTRLGVRYPELLSFVAAYNEQRFASIEARLTALEAV